MNFILRIISIPFSILAYTLLGFYFVLFHPIQWICLRLFGYEAHKRSVDALNFMLLSTMPLLFSWAKVEFRSDIPEGKAIIFAANHQSMFDIMTMGWFLRRYHPKYVSKIELAKNIPSVSFNLRHGGSAVIDRKNPRQALPELKKMGEYINTHKRSVVLYPEGTRSRTGVPGEFAANGLKILCKYAPDVLVVPVSINNSWKINRYGTFPLGLGSMIKLTVHEPIAVSEQPFEELFEITKERIISAIEVK